MFVNGKEFIKEAKNQSVTRKLSLENISADFNQADRKSTGLYGYVYDFSVDYNAITNDKIHDIHRYLMEKNNIALNVWCYKKSIYFNIGFFQPQYTA